MKEILIYGESNFQKHIVTAEDLLRYGEVLTDDEDLYDMAWCEPNSNHRIRTIAYNNHIYYHKMEKLLK